MTKNTFYYLGFSHFFGIGPLKLKQLIAYYGSVKKAYQANINEKFVEFRKNFDPEKKLAELKKKNIAVLTWEDKNYPQLLKMISDPPICLYVRGEFDFNHYQNYFAVVGTRSPTSYGRQITQKLTFELAAAGFIIVSGLAIGIDSLAHSATLEAGGRTVAVLGCGVDIIYPAENNYLYWQIIKKGGAIVSEFPPGQLVKKGLFIARNRIISGLSQGVLIIEGLEVSGSLITARFAAEQGREVFAPPSPITSKMSEAPNLLLKEGAKLVTGINDILEEFKIKITPKQKENIFKKLTQEEKEIYELVAKEALSADEISRAKKIPVAKTLNFLSLLEIKGAVEKDKQGRYLGKIIS